MHCEHNVTLRIKYTNVSGEGESITSSVSESVFEILRFIGFHVRG